MFPDDALDEFETHEEFLMPADKGFPLKEGFELLTDLPDAEPNPKQTFRFTVVLNEPGVAEGKLPVETLQQFVGLVERIVTDLTARLRSIPPTARGLAYVGNFLSSSARILATTSAGMVVES